MTTHLAKSEIITGSYGLFSSFYTALLTDCFHLPLTKSILGSFHSRDVKPKVVLIISKERHKNWYFVINLMDFPAFFFIIIFNKSLYEASPKIKPRICGISFKAKNPGDLLSEEIRDSTLSNFPIYKNHFLHPHDTF